MPPDARRGIVLADGAVADRATLDRAWPAWADGVELVVAADGGARHAAPLGLSIDRWVGDGDSIDAGELERLQAAGTRITRAAAAKDESDAELALLAAIEAGANEVIVLGALGGKRIDHALANLGLLQHPALDGRAAWLYDQHGARISLLAGPGSRALAGRIGDLVTLLPVGSTAEGVSTIGLEYPFASERLVLGRTRGVSNVKVDAEAFVALDSGRILVIETPVTVDR